MLIETGLTPFYRLAIDIALLTRRLANYIGRIATRSVVHRDN